MFIILVAHRPTDVGRARCKKNSLSTAHFFFKFWTTNSNPKIYLGYPSKFLMTFFSHRPQIMLFIHPKGPFTCLTPNFAIHHCMLKQALDVGPFDFAMKLTQQLIKAKTVHALLIPTWMDWRFWLQLISNLTLKNWLLIFNHKNHIEHR